MWALHALQENDLFSLKGFGNFGLPADFLLHRDGAQALACASVMLLHTWLSKTLRNQKHAIVWVCICMHVYIALAVTCTGTFTFALHYIAWHYIDQYCVALHYIPYDPNTMPYMYIHRMYYIASVALHRLRYITLSHTVSHRIASHRITSNHITTVHFFITFTCTFTSKCTFACTITRHDIILH